MTIKNCLVTGGSGYVGQRLANLLTIKGYNVRILSRKKNTTPNYFISDLNQENIDPDMMQSIDTVFHLAAHTHDISGSDKEYKKYWNLNVEASKKLAALAKKKGVKIFSYISSIKASHAEDAIDNGVTNIYGTTKLEAEKAILKIAKNSPMKVNIIRPSLVYGPNPKGNLGAMIKGIQAGWFPKLDIAGNKKSMIHVDDLALAILFIAINRESDSDPYVVNDGMIYSSRDIYEKLLKSQSKNKSFFSLSNNTIEWLSFLVPFFRQKLEKILEDDYHPSKRLTDLGFRSELKLENINETLF